MTNTVKPTDWHRRGAADRGALAVLEVPVHVLDHGRWLNDHEADRIASAISDRLSIEEAGETTRRRKVCRPAAGGTRDHAAMVGVIRRRREGNTTTITSSASASSVSSILDGAPDWSGAVGQDGNLHPGGDHCFQVGYSAPAPDRRIADLALALIG